MDIALISYMNMKCLFRNLDWLIWCSKLQNVACLLVCLPASVSLLKDLKHANIVTLHDIIYSKSLVLIFEYMVSYRAEPNHVWWAPWLPNVFKIVTLWFNDAWHLDTEPRLLRVLHRYKRNFFNNRKVSASNAQSCLWYAVWFCILHSRLDRTRLTWSSF